VGYVGGGYSTTGDYVFKTTDAGATWTRTKLPSSYAGHTTQVTALDFVNATTGYIGSWAGDIYKTTDAGATWQHMLSAIRGCKYLEFVDANTGWSIGYDDAYKTTDGGLTWRAQYIGTTKAALSGGSFPNMSTGWLAGHGMYKTVDGGTTWRGLPDGGRQTPHDLTAVHFISPTHGWAVGPLGTILRTTDAGESWITESLAMGSVDYNSVFFANAGTGWAMGSYYGTGVIYKSTDGGRKWGIQSRYPGVSLNASHFTSDKRGWVAGDSGLVVRTEDGGLNWQRQPTPTVQKLEAVWFVDDTTGFVAGARATLLKTTDGGTTWKPLAVGLPAGLAFHSVYFIDRLLGWAAADCFVYRTTDGGKTWTLLLNDGYRKFHAVHFLDAKRGWTAGTCFMNCPGDGMISYTSDGGKTWTDTYVPFVKALSFPNGMHGWAASTRGTIHKFTGALERSNTIRGTVFEDRNNNCVRDADEAGMAGVPVKASPGTFYGLTDQDGNYAIQVDTGRFTITQTLPRLQNTLYRQTCPAAPSEQAARFATYGNEAAGKDFANTVTQLCPQVSVDVAADRRRRCFRSSTTITYDNQGTGTATDVVVKVKYPQHLVPLRSTVAWSGKEGLDTYVFRVGNLAPGQSGRFIITDSVACTPGITGLTQCVEATVSPANFCVPPSSAWSKSSLKVEGQCLSDLVRFRIINAGSGDMAGSSAYRLYADNALVGREPFTLKAGDTLTLQVRANGQTLRLEADQEAGHPGSSRPRATVEACGVRNGGVSLGFVTQAPLDNADATRKTDCALIVDSFDPNDKLVAPTGTGDAHYTPSGVALDYTIRFQNTGTAEAYTVVLVDTLPASLDVSTLRPAGSSHPSRLNVSGKGRPVLTWTFNNINLPDNTTNEPASHGYVKFTVMPFGDLPQGTAIANYADIFFDYNEPVRTNTTRNVIRDTVFAAPGTDLLISPCDPEAVAVAGPDRQVCGQDTVRLNAAVPATGRGRWQLVSGTGTLLTPGEPTTLVTGLGFGENVFEWRVSNCSPDSARSRTTVTRVASLAGRTAIQAIGTDSLRCTTPNARYAWFLNGQPLHLTSQTIRAEKTGSYTVSAAAGNCAPELSAAFVFAPTAAEDPVPASALRVYPNPAQGAVHVALETTPGSTIQVTLVTATGVTMVRKKVHTGRLSRWQEIMHLSQPGVYLLRIETAQQVWVRKVVIR
jgi:photosystem II stability/assembly factor-like uncharacterized protein